jgi:hypothetical protein
MTLKTADDFNRLKALLERHIPNLKFNRSKLVAIALGESSLISAAKARTNNKASTEEFARELAADSQSIFKLSGGASVRDKINRSVKADVTMLGRVSDKIKKAAAEFKEKSPAHHVTLVALPNVQRASVRTAITTVVVASLVISAVMIACPPLAIAISILTTAALSGAITASIVAGAVILVGRIAANVGTEEGRNKVAECIAAVDTKYNDCVATHPLIAVMGGCLAEWVINATSCLTAE